MIKILYSVKRIKKAEDFVECQSHLENVKQYCSVYAGSLEKTWEIVHNTLKPGKPEDETEAMEISILGQDMSLSEDGKVTFVSIIFNTFANLFSPDCILSCAMESNGDPHCYITVIPMDRRVPNASKWIHSIRKDQPSDDLKLKLETALSAKFKDILVTGKVSEKDKEALGYSKELISFKPPEISKAIDSVQYYRVNESSSQVQTVLPFDKIRSISNDILAYFIVGPERHTYELSQMANTEVTPDVFMNKVKSEIARQYPDMCDSDQAVITENIRKAIFENYIIEPLINDERISDIMVLSPDNVRVKVGGDRFSTNIKFMGAEDYLSFIYRLAVRNHLDIQNNAINVFSDTTSNKNFRMRFNITTPYINSSEFPYLHVRKIAKHKKDIGKLMQEGMLDQTIADYLVDRARNSSGMIFCGKGASGKTTLMNALLDCIPFNRSGLVIQESEELFSNVHPHLMFEHVTSNASRGMPQYDLKDLARNGLLTDLDYFVIGEVKGAEAKYFINAADTGHQCWCSVHSPSSLDAIEKLADYVMYETSYSKDDATYMLKALDTIVFMKYYKVCEISKIVGWDHEKKSLIYSTLYKRPTLAC